MKTRAALVVAVLGAASSVWAQAPETEGTITYTLRYQVATPTGSGASAWSTATLGAVNTGSVNSGQGALFTIFASMSGSPEVADPTDPTVIIQAGSAQHWTAGSPAGTSGNGTLSGFWSGDINVNGGANTNGTWSDTSGTAYGSNVNRRTRTWTTANLAGDVTPGGSQLTNIQPAQFGSSPNELNHLNNVVAWQGLWIPASYSARTVNWSAALGSLGLLTRVAIRDDNGYQFVVDKSIATAFAAGISFNVVPAPASLALLGLGGLVAARRRRA